MEEYPFFEGDRPKPILLKMGYGESIPDLSWSVCGIDSAVSTSQAISGSLQFSLPFLGNAAVALLESLTYVGKEG